MSTVKSKMRAAVAQQNLPSNAKNASVNRAGGVAFEIEDPALKLVTMTAGAFFMEPRFYDGELGAKRQLAGKNASTASRFAKMEQRLNAAVNDLSLAPKSELDSVTLEIITAASEIAKGSNPEDLLIIARWLRNDMNMRMTPQALLVIASRMDATKGFVRAYAPTIVLRPDEVKTCILIHRYFFGMKVVNNPLGNGLSDRMAQFGEKALLKYDGPGWPTWKDVLNILPRRGAGKPVSKEIAAYFISNKIVDENATPVIAARKELASLTTLSTRAKDLARKSQVNWEVLLSQFGQTDAGKKEVWEYLIDENLLGYMALMRNLRNILQAGVSVDAISKVSMKIADRDEVLRSKQLPFRFLSAYRSLVDGARIRDEADMSELLAALELASNVAAENIHLPGTTAIFVDASGSMSNVRVSSKSTVTCAEAASMMAGIVAKACDRAYVFGFACDIKEVRFSKTDTVIGVAKKIPTDGVNGHNTNAYKIPLELAKLGLKPDRVIILSDLQAWDDSSMTGSNSRLSDKKEKAVCDTWGAYHKTSKDTWLHCVHLNGSGDTPVNEGERVNQAAGFSEKVFDMLLKAEGNASAAAVPTVQQIRDKFTLSQPVN